MTVVSPADVVYKTRTEAETGMKNVKVCSSPRRKTYCFRRWWRHVPDAPATLTLGSRPLLAVNETGPSVCIGESWDTSGRIPRCHPLSEVIRQLAERPKLGKRSLSACEFEAD